MSLIPAPHRTAPHHPTEHHHRTHHMHGQATALQGYATTTRGDRKNTQSTRARAPPTTHTHVHHTHIYNTCISSPLNPQARAGPRQAFRFARAQSFIWHCFAVSLCIAHPPWTRLALQASRFLHVYPVRILSAHPPFALSTPCAGSSPSPQGIVEEQRKRTKRKKKKKIGSHTSPCSVRKNSSSPTLPTSAQSYAK